jgi:hypothetical protein
MPGGLRHGERPSPASGSTNNTGDNITTVRHCRKRRIPALAWAFFPKASCTFPCPLQQGCDHYLMLVRRLIVGPATSEAALVRALAGALTLWRHCHDPALSRLKHGFESRRERQSNQRFIHLAADSVQNLSNIESQRRAKPGDLGRRTAGRAKAIGARQ